LGEELFLITLAWKPYRRGFKIQLSIEQQQAIYQRIHKMTELSFAKSFLATLDSRPTRLSADHVEDPRSYPARGAV